MIVYRGDPKYSSRKVEQLINTFIKVAGYTINSKKVDFLYKNDKGAEKDQGNNMFHNDLK